MKSGFTLVEMSLVLVIIGLIAGGLLIGQDLINAAEVRSQITQIDKFNSAMHAFQNKYGYLPGDIPDPYATNFGFQPRSTAPGEGDGNGIVEGDCGGWASGFDEGCGELPVFWVDLSTAKMIEYNIAFNGTYPSMTTPTFIISAWLPSWIPTAKIGKSNYVYLMAFNGVNYFSVSAVDGISWTLSTTANPGITVQQANDIDKKMDDGLPQSGGVIACYVNANLVDHQAVWAAGATAGTPNQGANGNSGWGYNCVPTTAATGYATTNCYDNSNAAGTGIAGAKQQYATRLNANMPNCALSFKFQ